MAAVRGTSDHKGDCCMQERYLGDSHDFIKYALLRHLHRTTCLRLGVNWYLTDPKRVDGTGNNHGEKRHHLTHPEWKRLDPELLEKIRAYEAPKSRIIKNVERDQVLPSDTVYFDDEVPNAINRASWHTSALKTLSDTDLVFLDPDIGFQVPSMEEAKSPKYAFYSEAADWLKKGKVCISIQFASHCDPVKRGQTVRDKMHEVALPGSKLPIIRGRVAPNILFLALSPDTMAETIERAFASFTGLCPSKIELIH